MSRAIENELPQLSRAAQTLESAQSSGSSPSPRTSPATTSDRGNPQTYSAASRKDARPKPHLQPLAPPEPSPLPALVDNARTEKAASALLAIAASEGSSTVSRISSVRKSPANNTPERRSPTDSLSRPQSASRPVLSFPEDTRNLFVRIRVSGALISFLYTRNGIISYTSVDAMSSTFLR